WEQVPVKFRYPLPLPVQSSKRSEAEGVLPPSLSVVFLGHLTGPRRLPDHS
ncbi:unnamed protein product, partial [Staurois parvus]